MNITFEQGEQIFESFYDTMLEVVCNLMDRWYDEFQYEDINDYKKSMQLYASKNGFSIDGLKGTQTKWTILVNNSVYIFCQLKDMGVTFSWSRKCHYDKMKGSPINFD